MEDLSHYNPEGSTLRRAQLRMLEILKVVDDICTKHGIQYTLDGGTLIGAVRHGGFIPWDDDIDIALFRDDYDKLLKIMDTELSDEYYVLNLHKHEDCYFSITRVCLKGTKFQHPNALPYSFNEGICIDIFPLDNVPNSHIKRIIHHYRCNLYFILVLNSAFNFNPSNKVLSLIHSIIYHALKTIPGSKNLIKRFDNCLTKYNNKTNYVTSLTSQVDFLKFGKYGFFDKRDFEPSKKIKFEDIEINIQENYDKILTTLYGDYMALPPEEDRRNHSEYLVDFGKY